MFYICFTKVYTRRSYCWTKGEKMVYKEAKPTHHLADCTNQQKETVITLDSQNSQPASNSIKSSYASYQRKIEEIDKKLKLWLIA